ALRGMSLGVEKNTVLGLLGPNGAGKSTMIHLLTGLYKPTSGTAYVAGANIDNQMSLVHLRTGVCPQHDILWDELTIADHLLFYSRLRGVPPALEQQAVAYAIASVCLTKFRDRQVKSLSGGERRRVSIAISMLGDNRVIFLDEPTTGLDPAIRRIIWDVVNRIKVDRTVVLTTHSMEEADVLSDRIAIMTEGQLRCLGTSLHLKELYGSGFRLSVTSKPG
ncbi:MAG: P-loop containing nucleoside triphosphate hydrolase protein, partial [Podila humilis]